LTIKFTLNTEYLDKKSGVRSQESESTPKTIFPNISQMRYQPPHARHVRRSLQTL